MDTLPPFYCQIPAQEIFGSVSRNRIFWPNISAIIHLKQLLIMGFFAETKENIKYSSINRGKYESLRYFIKARLFCAKK